jgi:hypothetical protein
MELNEALGISDDDPLNDFTILKIIEMIKEKYPTITDKRTMVDALDYSGFYNLREEKYLYLENQLMNYFIKEE